MNRFALATKPSGIRSIANLAAQRSQASLPVFPFHLGEPDFDTPAEISAAAIQALESGHTRYPPNAGIPALREGIAAALTTRFGFPLEAADITVTVGACEALSLAFMACLEPGDEVVASTPCWPNYLQVPALLGATVREVPADDARGFQADPDELVAASTPSTRMMVLNTPNNPSGAILDAKGLRHLLDLARERGIWVVVDEIYQDIVYDAHHASVLTVVRDDDPLIYIGGFSKSYAMTGWRLGYAASKGQASLVMQRLHQALVTSVTSFAQHGALAAMGCDEAVEAMRRTYWRRRDRVLQALASAGLDAPVPAGGFYVFPRVPAGWTDATAFARYLLEQHGVAVVPGKVFGDAHADRFRLCFACEDALLDEGLEVLVSAVRSASEGTDMDS
jgi:aspartate/methionine/tyrosine aminotransferase